MVDDGRIGFIGAGMMAEAIARGLTGAGVEPERITAYDPDARRQAVFAGDLNTGIAESNLQVVEEADTIIVAVKPFAVSDVLSEVAPAVGPGKLIISIAAGIPTGLIEAKVGEGAPVVRAMPNTPCLIGEGATAIAPGRHATPAHMELAESIFKSVGSVVRVTEDKMDAVTGLSGSGPAYVYTFIEALADGGVRMGLPRATAQLLAAQTVLGAARMVVVTGEHPAELRDKVTTPGGTTIAGLAVLESAGFRSASIEAVTAAAKRSSELGKK